MTPEIILRHKYRDAASSNFHRTPNRAPGSSSPRPVAFGGIHDQLEALGHSRNNSSACFDEPRSMSWLIAQVLAKAPSDSALSLYQYAQEQGGPFNGSDNPLVHV